MEKPIEDETGETSGEDEFAGDAEFADHLCHRLRYGQILKPEKLRRLCGQHHGLL